LGYSPPPEDRLKIDVAYSSCTFDMPDDVIDGDLGILVTPTPESPRGGGLIDMGNGQWLVSLSGYSGTHPPVTPEGFIDFTRSLADPSIYNALQRAHPTGKPVRFRITEVTRRRYDKLARFPNRFVVLGDAVSTFNPVYGQGMSVAALGAIALRDGLRRHGADATVRLRPAIAKASAAAWATSTGSDRQMPFIGGRRSMMGRLSNAYLARLIQAAHTDPVVAVAFMRVVNLLDAPILAMRPSVVARVLVNGLQRRRGRTPTASACHDAPNDIAGPQLETKQR
jgi:hypothetical protein